MLFNENDIKILGIGESEGRQLKVTINLEDDNVDFHKKDVPPPEIRGMIYNEVRKAITKYEKEYLDGDTVDKLEEDILNTINAFVTSGYVTKK